MRKNIKTLELFYRPSCPYCNKVRTYMQNHDIDNVTLYDIETDGAAYERLKETTGREQVPCLFIDGKPLFESDDIIAFFAQLQDDKEANRAQ